MVNKRVPRLQADSGFAPILGDAPKVLILGTLPSQRSLREKQYYGHPQNAFWWIMAQVLGFDPQLPYSERALKLREKGVAVWDVIASCVRPGSLDADIDTASVQTNDFSDLFQKNPSLNLLAFNGKAAQRLYRQQVLADWSGPMLALPSTSPAYAAMSRDAKLSEWRQLRAYL